MRDTPPEPAPRPRLWPLPVRILCGALGVTLFLVGVAGVFLPVLPGVPFLLASVFLLGRSSPAVQRRVADLEQRGPRWLQSALRFGRRGAPVPVEADSDPRP